MILWLVTFAASSLVGVPLLIHEGLSMGELRQLARAEAEAEKVGKHVTLSAVQWENATSSKGRGGPRP
jgi:hypothetical protein